MIGCCKISGPLKFVCIMLANSKSVYTYTFGNDATRCYPLEARHKSRYQETPRVCGPQICALETNVCVRHTDICLRHINTYVQHTHKRVSDTYRHTHTHTHTRALIHTRTHKPACRIQMFVWDSQACVADTHNRVSDAQPVCRTHISLCKSTGHKICSIGLHLTPPPRPLRTKRLGGAEGPWRPGRQVLRGSPAERYGLCVQAIIEDNGARNRFPQSNG